VLYAKTFKSVNRTMDAGGGAESDTTFEIEYFGMDAKRSEQDARNTSFNKNYVQQIGRMKDLVNNFLTEENSKGNREKAKGLFLHKKKRNALDLFADELDQEKALKEMLDSLKESFKEVRKKVLKRIESIVVFWQKNYIFRFHSLNHSIQLMLKDQRNIVAKQEKTLRKMVIKYGHRVASFLHGEIMQTRKKEFKDWEEKHEVYKRTTEEEIERSETQMFLNYFSYIPKHLQQNQLLSLLHLKPSKALKINFDNVGFRNFYQYLISFEDINELIVVECRRCIELISPFLDQKYKKSYLEYILQMLKHLVGILHWKFTEEEVIAIIPKIKGFDHIYDKMVEKTKIIIDALYLNHQKQMESHLLNLKIAFLFSKYYLRISNEEKSYRILRKAMKDVKPMLEQYVELFAQYQRIKEMLSSFLPDDTIKSTQDFERQRMIDWGNQIIDSRSRAPYVIGYLKYLKTVLSIEEIIEIFDHLSVHSLEMREFKESQGFCETLILLLQIDKKLKINKRIMEPERRHKELLALNRRLMVIKNRLIEACVKDGNYLNAFKYLICLIFIYYNSVKVIEGTDPSKYPVVRPNEFFTQASTKDQSVDREHYQELLDFINEAYKKALVQYGAIWDFIVKNPLKFPKSFFIAAKDCIDRFGSCSLFSRSAYYGYIKEVLQVATARLPFKNMFSSYQQNYIGSIENKEVEEFVDTKIQHIVRKHNLERVDDLKPGKMNILKASLYYKFIYMDLTVMSQITSKAVYFAEKNFLAKRGGSHNDAVPLIQRVRHIEEPIEFFRLTASNLSDFQANRFKEILHKFKIRFT
jgi:hypothetical protein